MLKLIQLLSGVFDKVLDNVLFAQPIAAGDGILKVLLQRIVLANYTGCTAFCGDSM